MASANPKDAIDSYITDMLALERHIQKALDGQIQDLKDYPTVTGELEKIQQTVEFHISTLEGVANARNAQGAGSAIKKVGSALLGFGAAAVDLVRNEGMPKNLRDDYSAFSLATIGYVMLHTTAISLGDQEVSSLAQRHLNDYTKVVSRLNAIVPPAVIQFLKEEGLPASEQHLSEINRNIENAWSQSAAATTGAAQTTSSRL